MENQAYTIARTRVKKIKSFYSHLIVFVAVNLLIVYINITNLPENESYFQFKNFITFTFWGIGLLAHALTLFLPNLLFKNWEKKKINEILEKQKKNNWE